MTPTPKTPKPPTISRLLAVAGLLISRCPECRKDTPHSLCDGCKFETCNICNYPCACGGEDPEIFGEAWMAQAESGSASTGAWVESAGEAQATAQAEGLAAADLDGDT